MAEELTIVLFVIGVVLLVVTLVGHGIWVLVSRLFGGSTATRTSSGHPSTARPSDERRCPSCDTPLEFGQQACAVCGWPNVAATRADGRAALRTLRRQLDEFTFRGALDDAARERLLAAIQVEEARLAERSESAPIVEPLEQVELTPVEETAPAASEPAAGLAASEVAPIAKPQAALPLTPPSTTPAPAPVGERAKRYAASRQTAAVEVGEVAPVVAAAPAEPSEPASRLFAAFMEENNIRWGELVGGLLIVGCSVALVISLWSQIAGRPLLQFVLFNGVTAALFGVGIYTDRRWKIHTTSRGVLVIATLLVPLNFLALAAFTQASPPTDLLPLVGEVLSLVVFALLVYIAGRTLVPDDAVLLTVGVMVPCLMQLLVRRFASPTMGFTSLYALAAVPVATHLASASLTIRRRWTASESAPLSEIEANRTLLFVGLVSAATIMPLALLMYYVPPLRETLHWLSPLVAICGLPALLAGLLFWQRLRSAASSGLQTAGIGVGALGAMLMVAAVALARPDPATIVPAALLTAAAMLAVAAWFGIPAAHVPAGVSLAAVAVIGYYVLRGQVGWTVDDADILRNALLSATTGKVLMPLVAAFGAVAWWLRRIGRGEDSFMYGLVTAATAAASLAVIVWFGFARAGDPQNIAWMLAVYALAALAAGVWLGRPDAARAGSALLLAALVQAIVFRYGAMWQLQQPWVAALLAHAVLMAVGAAILATYVAAGFQEPSALRVARRMDVLRALIWSAHATSIAGAAWLLCTAHTTSAGVLASYLVCVTGVWMLLSVLNLSPALFTASQVAVVLSILCGVTAAVEGRAWYQVAEHPWLDPWFVEAQVVVLAAFCLIAKLVRWWVSWRSRGDTELVVETQPPVWLAGMKQVIEPPWPTVSQILDVVIVAAAAFLAVYAVVPGVARELSLTESVDTRVVPPAENLQFWGAPHTHASGAGAWGMLAAVAAAVAAGMWRRSSQWRIVGLTVLAMAVCPLIASRWDSQVAVASALRWVSAAFFAIASVTIWVASPNVLSGTDDGTEVSRRRLVRDLLVAFVVFVYVALGVYVAQAALRYGGPSANVQELIPWALGWAFVAGVVGLLLPYASESRGRGGDVGGGFDNAWARHARNVLLLLAAAPAAILATFAVATVLDQHPIVGPDPGTWFRQMGWDVSYGAPLAMIALAFIGYAVRDRSSRLAFAAGLLFNIVATMVVLLRLARGAGMLDAAAWILVAQVNAIVAGMVALVWRAGERWLNRTERMPADFRPPLGETPPQGSLLLVTQAALAAALCATFLVPGVVNLLFDMPPARWAAAADGVYGWTAVALATAASVWLSWGRGIGHNGVGILAAAIVALVALTAARTDTGNWQAYHTLLAGSCVVACVLPFAARAADLVIAGGREQAALPIVWSSGAGRCFRVAAVLLAFWGYDNDPARPWWTVGVLLAICVLCVWIAWYEARQRPMWFAAAVAVPAVSLLWLDWGRRFSPTRGGGQLSEFLWINMIALAVVALVSVWIERRRVVARSEMPLWKRGLSFHRFGMWTAVVTLLSTTFAGLFADYLGETFDVSLQLAWTAWVAVAVAGAACLWDPAMRFSLACLYCIGLVAVGMYLDSLDLRAPLFHWALANALAAYLLLTSGLWSVRGRIGAVMGRLGAPVRQEGSERLGEHYSSASRRDAATWGGAGHGWLVPVNLATGAFVLLLVMAVELSVDNFVQRMVAAYAVGAQVFAIGLLAHGRARVPLQYTALVWGVLFTVAFSWAFLPPDLASPWLHRLVLTVLALSVAVVVYGFVLVKFLTRENEWTRAAMRLVPPLAMLTVVLILVVLGMETVAYMERGEVNVAMPALVAIGIALVGLTAAALAAALLPGRDPLGLSERGRMLYIYAAEGLAALLFVHIRVTMPWLFTGWFQQFWPLIVMAIAFIGVGFGELFGRRQQRVLSEPLHNTGALLPLLPVIGFWFVESRVNYSLVLLSIGVLYASLSVLRRSMLYGALAAVAANGSLWYLLHDKEGLSFLNHPQLWLIPPALSALAAGYINRKRLTAQQSAALRYASAIVIYVSSTMDIFINGVAEAPWLPAVLAGLSILGVLAGIMLRVRAFLYLGTAFLVVAIMTIIWHAGSQHTWIWWVAGIVVGALIIAMFGLFEKRRDDVLRVVDELKHWQA